MAPPAPPVSRESERGLAGRLGSYRVIYVAVAAFALLYVFTVHSVESALRLVFETRVDEALDVQKFDESVSVQIQRRIAESVQDSGWVRWGGVRADVIVIGRDGRTLIYAGGPTSTPPDAFDLLSNLREAERLLPASAQVTVTLPHNTVLANGILVLYAAALIQGLFVYNRSLARRERAGLEAALGARDAAARRAESIEVELDTIRQRMLEVEPADREQALEVQTLRTERERLQGQLAALAARY